MNEAEQIQAVLLQMIYDDRASLVGDPVALAARYSQKVQAIIASSIEVQA